MKETFERVTERRGRRRKAVDAKKRGEHRREIYRAGRAGPGPVRFLDSK